MSQLAGNEAAPPNAHQTVDCRPALEQLRELCRGEQNAKSLPAGLTAPLDLEQLEMLEAELRNQGILPAESEGIATLTQHALHTASILRWRARRAGAWSDDLNFSVNLPEYLLTRADELLGSIRSSSAADPGEAELLVYRARSWGQAHTPGQRLYAELDYLERFASYLIGEYDKSTNNYHQGLNLILRVLVNRRSKAIQASLRRAPEPTGPRIVLPIELSRFLSVLRKQKSERVGVR